MVFQHAANDVPQTFQVERARNPDDVHSIVGVQVVPLEHGPLKQVQSALHTLGGATSAGPNAVTSILIPYDHSGFRKQQPLNWRDVNTRTS
jgi:hypothetical protein